MTYLRTYPRAIKKVGVKEFNARKADPIWLHENGDWEYMAY